MVCESCPKRMTCLRNDHICVTTACSCRVIGCWPSAASSGRLSQSLPLTAPIINAFQTRRHGGVGGVEGAQAAVHGPPAPKGRGALDTAESGREEVWAASGGGRTDARPAPWRRRIPNCHACRLVSGVDQLQRGMGGGSHLKHSVCTAECMPEGLCRRRPDPPDKPAHLPGCLAAVTPPPMGLHRRGGSKLGDLRAFRATTPPPALSCVARRPPLSRRPRQPAAPCVPRLPPGLCVARPPLPTVPAGSSATSAAAGRARACPPLAGAATGSCGSAPRRTLRSLAPRRLRQQGGGAGGRRRAASVVAAPLCRVGRAAPHPPPPPALSPPPSSPPPCHVRLRPPCPSPRSRPCGCAWGGPAATPPALELPLAAREGFAAVAPSPPRPDRPPLVAPLPASARLCPPWSLARGGHLPAL